MWLPRVFLLAYFAWVGAQQLMDAKYWSLFNNLNLPIHEGGHLLFRFAGRFIHVLGGTLLQLLAPLASMIMFYRQRDYFAIAVCFGWLSTNFLNIGVYMSDAIPMVLPLVTVGHSGGISTHDWRYLFTSLGLLSSSAEIGMLVRLLGHLTMLGCLAFGVWLLVQMYKNPIASKRKLPGQF